MKPASNLLPALLAIFFAFSAQATAATGALTSATGWQAKRAFPIEWDPIAPSQPTEAVYRIWDSQDQLVLGFHRPFSERLKDVEVPAVPDVYTLEAWLENSADEAGPPSFATLRFDDTVPSPPGLDSPPGWILGTQPAAVQIAAAPDPLPLSGFEGFAVSVDRGSDGFPCAQTDICRADEIDLAGYEGGTVALGTLPEGIHFVRVAAVSGAGVPSEVTTAAVRIDGSAPALSLAAPAGWSNRPVLVTAHAADPLSGMAAAGPLGPFTAIAVDGAAPARTLGDAASAWVTGSGAHAVEYFARDLAGNLSDTAGSIVRIDEDPPRASFAASQDPAEPERIEATVGDPLSGPSPDRGSIAIRPAGTGLSFEPLPTRNAGDRLVAHWDSDSYPPGKYEFLATAFDLAGNTGAGTNRDRGGRMVLVNPLKAQVGLEIKLSGRRLNGRLWRVGGGPVAGRDVTITETFAPGSRPRQRTTVVGTDNAGAFSLRLRQGPSRDVVARFAGTALLTRATGDAAHLAAATKVQLRASATTARVGGKPVVFSGKVAHRGAATVGGLPVELQFRFRGGAWSEFRTVETNARGRFRYRYRFSDDDSRGVSFQFRAQIKGREGWPYGPGTSRPVKVTGR
ncbi:MAG TPA: hypothetical protein VFS54_08870 [Solirubrobacterales bacterium]|nr:hypothetical protein [Solirubrobacterales bacterium]